MQIKDIPMSDPVLYPVPSEWAQRARMTLAGYEAARVNARETPDDFWSEQAQRLDWVTAPSRIKDVSFDRADFRINWFGDGVLNVAYNCLDRHLAERGDETAIIWE
ncbi:MAG: acetyl-coenzyme A synthetase N-terminal domain-containing protein, partial [Brevundimonas sp.]|nr:acetyl-coenzyme A synthetase N-terminal domain-containing protein [Brevundimonas sp.]